MCDVIQSALARLPRCRHAAWRNLVTAADLLEA